MRRLRRPAWLTREVWGWSLFDFANQSFTIVVLTAMFAVYFVDRIVAEDVSFVARMSGSMEGGAPLDADVATAAAKSAGRQLWSLCGIVTQIVLVLVGPVIGALADFSGTKKRLLFVTYVGCVLFTFAMSFVQPGQAWLGAALFIAAYLFYGAGENFLSAFLPELASHRDMGRVSAFSWTIAYVGALISLLVAVAITQIVPGAQEAIPLALASGQGSAPDALAAPASGELPLRTSAWGYQLATAWAALFFLVAGIPMFLWVPERQYHEAMPVGQTLWTIGFHRIASTARQLARYRQLFQFLAIMTVYFAGMQIIYWFGGVLTKELFGFSDVQMGLFLVLSTAVAIPGAAITGRYQDRIGTRNTILIGLAFWSLVMLAAAASTTFAAIPWVPWAIGALVGLGIGGLGSASRAMVGLFSPPQKSAEFFGFYGIAHKLSAMLGLGWIVLMERIFAGRFEWVVASATVFFALGFVLMLFVDEKQGRVNALRAAKSIERSARADQSATPTDDLHAAPASLLPESIPSPSATARDAAADVDARVVYLDNNATTRPAPEVVAAIDTALRERWHNPSSVHRPGQAARHRVDLARESVARLVGASGREIVFTSGGTEAANLAIVGALDVAIRRDPRRRVVVTSRLEHSAVRELAESLAERGRAEIVWLTHDPSGIVDRDALAKLLRERAAEIAVVSVMWANNETGLVQPIDEIGACCREHQVRIHSDGTQWVGRMPTDVSATPIDLLSFAAHKFHGPKGVGALWIRRGVRLEREIVGGPQEHERRGGTENTPGIVGMGVAAELALAWLETSERERLAALRDRLETGILAAIPDAVVIDASAPRLWNTTNIAFPRLEAEAILLLLSERGLCASAGAACSSGSLDPSPVLLAMGVPPEVAHGAVRFSLSRETTEPEIERAITLVAEAIAKLRRSGP